MLTLLYGVWCFLVFSPTSLSSSSLFFFHLAPQIEKVLFTTWVPQKWGAFGSEILCFFSLLYIIILLWAKFFQYSDSFGGVEGGKIRNANHPLKDRQSKRINFVFFCIFGIYVWELVEFLPCFSWKIYGLADQSHSEFLSICSWIFSHDDTVNEILFRCDMGRLQ